MAADAPKPVAKPGWLTIAIDYGPILVFFLVYKFYAPGKSGEMIAEIGAVVRGTIAFMISAIAAFVVSWVKLRHISPMLWLTTILIVFFGGLTVWTQDPAWISHKPTAVYLFGAVMLLGGWMRGKALLKVLLGAAFEGLDDDGWMKLSRNWGLFFILLAVVNEVFANRDWFTFDQWLKAKLWLFLPLSFIFTFAHMPMLLRHGLAAEAKDEAESETPHE